MKIDKFIKYKIPNAFFAKLEFIHFNLVEKFLNFTFTIIFSFFKNTPWSEIIK